MDYETAKLMRQITAFEKQLEGAGSNRRAKANSVSREEAKLAAEISEVEQILAGLSSGYLDEEPGCGAGMDEEAGINYMDEEAGISYMDEEAGISYMDVDLTSDDLLDDDFDDDFDDDLLDDDLLDDDDDLLDDDFDDDLLDDDDDFDEVGMGGGMFASEADPSGIEEEITDDHFSEVSRATNNDDISDAQHTFEVAPTELGHTAMKKASVRLDRLASYIENQVVNHGENKKWLKVAYRIDQMADSIDAKIKEAQEAE